MYSDTSTKGGFIKMIILIFVVLVILKYFFNITLADLFSNQIVKDIWSIIKTLFLTLIDFLRILLDFLKELVATTKVYVEGLKK